MQRDVASGSLLIAGALIGVLVMLLHPTGAEVGAARPGHGMALLNTLVHGAALVVAPVVFLGLLGLARALEPSHLTTAALVAWGWGAVAVLSAAVASGFVTPRVLQGSHLPEGLGHYSYLWNQGYAKVNTVATGIGMLLWGWAMLRTRGLWGPVLWGMIAGPAMALAVATGRLRLDLHGFAIVMLAQAVWLVWVGVRLCRRDGDAARVAEP